MRATLLLSTAFGLSFVSALSAQTYLARCQMDECAYYDQSKRQVIEEVEGAISGAFTSVELRVAYSNSETTPASDLSFDKASPVVFFCSKARPAFGYPDGTWQALNVNQIFGATETASAMYLNACHPESIRGAYDGVSLGYGVTSDAIYPSKAALLKP